MTSKTRRQLRLQLGKYFFGKLTAKEEEEKPTGGTRLLLVGWKHQAETFAVLALQAGRLPRDQRGDEGGAGGTQMCPKLELLAHKLCELERATDSAHKVALFLLQLSESCSCWVAPALLRVSDQLRQLAGGSPETRLNLPAKPVDPAIFPQGLQRRVAELMEDRQISC